MSRRLRIAVFASGSPMSQAAVEAIATEHEVVALIAPTVQAHGWRGKITASRMRRRLKALARKARAPLMTWDRAQVTQLREQLASRKADLICVATFPFIIPASVLATSQLGAINIHPSLLPRHRGADPIFWTYFYGDEQTGITIHWIDDGVDSGDIIAQAAVTVERGSQARQLYRQLTATITALLPSTLQKIAEGSASRMPQDASDSTHDPVPARPFNLPFDQWSAEHAWHFFAGVADMYGPLVADHAGKAIVHGSAIGFTLGGESADPGSVTIKGSRIQVRCVDGWVELAAPSRLRRWGRRLKSLLR